MKGLDFNLYFLSLVRSLLQGGFCFRRVARYVSFPLHTFEISTLCILVDAKFYSSRKLSSVSNASSVFVAFGVLDSDTFRILFIVN